MLREVRQAPEAAARLLDREDRRLRQLGARLRRLRPDTAIIAARGSSDNAAVYGKYLLEARLGLPVALAAPSVVTVLRRRLTLRRVVVLGVSQSGQSPDIVAFLEAARASGALAVALTNAPASPLARAAHETILTHAGAEHSVAATKTYLNQAIALALLTAAWARDGALRARLAGVPEMQTEVLGAEPEIARVTERYRYLHECIVAARGYDFGTARELALKLMETCHVVALPLSSADLLHGPIALVEHDFPVFVIAPPGPAFRHLSDVAGRLRRRQAETVILSSEPGILQQARVPVRLGTKAADAVAPPVYGVAIQLLAYHLARTKGLNPDRPRGLRKVTRTL
jgi:glucosamine--fructose-6-phosphate aminotransferase (isomerizing)